MRDYAKRENIEIFAEYVEKQSAKVSGCPIFNEMLDKIEKLGGNILAWHPDRLARNSVDGGRVIYLLDTGKLASLKFPTFWCDSTSQGKSMLNMAFGQSKYYVNSLSENTKRGLRQKVRRGEYPSLAPVGYIKDSRTKFYQCFKLYLELGLICDVHILWRRHRFRRIEKCLVASSE